MTTFPGIGKTMEADFGQWRLHLRFLSNQAVQIKSLTTGDEETVAVCILGIRPGLYMVNWTERDSTVVSHIQDYDNGVVTCLTTLHRGMQYRRGTFREVTYDC